MTVVEALAPGAGASGGVLGALAPFAPAPWDTRKAYQLRALLASEEDWRAVAETSRLDPGFARLGRLMPLATPAARVRAEALATAAAKSWSEATTWRVLDRWHGRWPAPDAAPFGVVHETLSARLMPRHAVAALAAAVVRRGGTLLLGTRIERIEPGIVAPAGGRAIHAGSIIVAAGAGTSSLLAPLIGRALEPGVKGQAALLAVAVLPGAPMIAGDGLFIVPRPLGRVAVGATSEPAEDQAASTHRRTDARLDALLGRARRVAPALADARVIERWAGIRPRGFGPNPLVGAVPGAPGLFVATGGYKTGFGLAHAIGRSVAALLAGAPDGLPDAYRPPSAGAGPATHADR